MGSFFDKVDADLARSIAALGQTFVYAGVTIPCGVTRPSAGNEPVEGGSWDEYSGVVFTRRAYFDNNLVNGVLTPLAIPVQGNTIVLDGKTVHVGKVKCDGACPLVTIPFANEPFPR